MNNIIKSNFPHSDITDYFEYQSLPVDSSCNEISCDKLNSRDLHTYT